MTAVILASVYLTPEAEAHIRLYKPSTYGIDLSADVAKELMAAGFVEPVPSPAWNRCIYGLTDAGAIYQDEHFGVAHDRP